MLATPSPTCFSCHTTVSMFILPLKFCQIGDCAILSSSDGHCERDSVSSYRPFHRTLAFAVPMPMSRTYRPHSVFDRLHHPRMTAREAPTGPYKVAAVDARLSADVTRGLRLRLFYPAPDEKHHASPPAPWFPPSGNGSRLQDETILGVLRFARLPAAPLLAPLLSAIPRQPIPASLGGPSAPSRFPLVLFSHGLGGSIANYCSLCIDIASHGYVVAAPEHTDASAFAAYIGDEREFIPYAHFTPGIHGPDFRRKQLETRRGDLDATLAAIRTADLGDGKFIPLSDEVEFPELTGKVDVQSAVVVGHSFGAATVLSYAAAHPGLARKVVCLDAWLQPLGEEFMRAVDLRDSDVLFVDQALSGMKDSVALREKIPRPSGQGTADAIKVLNGMHNNASDFPLRVPKYIAVAARMTAPGSDPLALLQAQNRAVASFLKGRESWQAFRCGVAAGEDEGLALASLGMARVLLKTEK